MTADDATPATPDPDEHVGRLRAQIDAANARHAGYRAEVSRRALFVLAACAPRLSH